MHLNNIFLYILFVLYEAKKFQNNTFVLGQYTTTSRENEVNLDDPKDLIKLLPEPSTTGERSREIKLGEAIKFEELGPIIINPDGTTRRITNWANLTKQEQASTFRLISARNKKRLAELQKRSENLDTIITDTITEVDPSSCQQVTNDQA
jgi:hypothetical protein